MVAPLRLLMLTVVVGLASPWPAMAAASVSGATSAAADSFVRLASRIDEPVRNPRRAATPDQDRGAETRRSGAAVGVRQAAVVRKPDDVPGATTAAAPGASLSRDVGTSTRNPDSAQVQSAAKDRAATQPALESGASVTPPPDDRKAAPAPEQPTPTTVTLVAIAFPEDGAILDDQARAELDRAVGDAAADPGLRFQLLAYARADGASASKARRLSLSRALAVRSYLMENGIAGNRIDVRALGDSDSDSADDAPRDRVDVRIVER